MATIKRFEDMDAWKMARELCKEMGALIEQKSFQHNYRLIDQVEGSAGSIMDNIAEGFERDNKGDFILFLSYAKASCGELRSQLYRALDRKYIDQEQFNHFSSFAFRISAMLNSLIVYLKRSEIPGLRKKA